MRSEDCGKLTCEHLPIDVAANARFRQLAADLGADPDNPWIGGYVDYEWEHGRHIYEAVEPSIAGKRVLEFGCNYGASSIVLAALGATVVGIDANARALRLAQANAARYQLGDRISFVLGSQHGPLPFGSETFDCIVCNSVLEYLVPGSLPFFQKELDRVLRPRGLIVVIGTSNRLAPREIHSRRWFVNLVPEYFDRWWPLPRRGVSPWRVRRGFGDYENMDWIGRGREYLAARDLMPAGDRGRWLRRTANAVARLFGVSVGLLTPSMSVVLRKKVMQTRGPMRDVRGSERAKR